MYLKSEGAFMTMTCDTPPGGVERIPKKPECLSNMQCKGKRSPMHNKCVQGKCVMQYRRLVKVGMMTKKRDYQSNTCNNMGPAWDAVKIDTDWEDKENIRGSTSTAKIRLCAMYSEEPVDEKKAETYGVCRMMLSETPCSEQDGFKFEGVTPGGDSDGDIGQYEHDPALYLCVSYNGCEGRGGDNIADPLPALAKIGLARNDEQKCPKDMRSGRLISTRGGATGDFNQNMWSGGDVWMCEERAKK